MAERAWTEKTVPDIRIQPLESLLSDQPLGITAANGTHVLFDGWADIDLLIGWENYRCATFEVPVLVSQDSPSCSLQSSTVIVELIKKTNQEPRADFDP